MKTALTAALACAVVGLTLAAQPAAAARYHDQERFMNNWCQDNPRDRDCRDWNDNRQSWNEDRYHSWYGRHRHEFGADDAAATIFGFAAGITGSILNGVADSSHDAACAAKYRSYNPDTNKYRVRGGGWRTCRL